ncbi:MAG: tetratricopeptide repeat protein, partial [Myxococcales bacterium]|nr:tetratricopeptide repeat protein [Myxococcales bacterium]
MHLTSISCTSVLMCVLVVGCAPRVARRALDDRLARAERNIEKVRFAIDTTKRLRSRSRAAPYLPQLHARLADLYIQQARAFIERARALRERRGDDSGHASRAAASRGVTSVQAHLLKRNAIETYRRLLALAPDYVHADRIRFFIGHELRELGDYPAMLAAYRELVAKHPRSPYAAEALLVLGDYWIARSQLDRAEKRLRQALGISAAGAAGARAVAAHKLAWVRLSRGDCKKALLLFERTLTLARASAAARPTRGAPRRKLDLRREALVDSTYCYAQVGDADHALSYYRARASSMTTYRAALRKLARRYAVKARYDAAARISRAVLRLGGGDVDDLLESVQSLYSAARNVAKQDDSAARDDVLLMLGALRRVLARDELSAKRRREVRTAIEV